MYNHICMPGLLSLLFAVTLSPCRCDCTSSSATCHRSQKFRICSIF